MITAKGQVVLGVLIMAAATGYLWALSKARKRVTWAGLAFAVATVLLGLLLFLTGVQRMRLYL